MFRTLLAGLGLAAAPLCGLAPATDLLRVATYNIKDIDIGSSSYDDLLDVLARCDADVVLLQEVGEAGGSTLSQSQAVSQVTTLSNDAGYQFRAVSSISGTMSGGLRNAVLSKFPITQVTSLDSVLLSGSGGANDMTRDILRTTIAVPDVAYPIAFFNVHFKASGGEVNEFRRAVELRRLEQAVADWCGQNPDGLAIAGGDFNWDLGNYTPKSFSSQDYDDFKDSGLPQTYDLGNDITFPVVYDPPATLGNLAGCVQDLAIAPATWEDSTTQDGTFQSGSRLDYLWAEVDTVGRVTLMADEVYRSQSDDGIDAQPAGQYLRKFGGGPLSSTTSGGASDHFPVVATYRIEDENGGRIGLGTPGQYALEPFAGYRGDASLGSTDFGFRVFQARPNTPALFLVGSFQFPAISLSSLLPDFFQGDAFLYVPLDSLVGTRITDAKGEADFALPIPNNPSLIGGPGIFTQWVVLDTDAAGGFATLTDAYFLQY